MRAILSTVLMLAVVAGAAYLLVGRDSGPEQPQYTVVLDNAFGVVKGADLKVAGVRAGTIEGAAIQAEDTFHGRRRYASVPVPTSHFQTPTVSRCASAGRRYGTASG